MWKNIWLNVVLRYGCPDKTLSLIINVIEKKYYIELIYIND